MKSFVCEYQDRYVQYFVDDTTVVIITRWPSAKKADDDFKKIKERAKKRGKITHLGNTKIAIRNLKKKFKPAKRIFRKRTIMGKRFRERINQEEKNK